MNDEKKVDEKRIVFLADVEDKYQQMFNDWCPLTLKPEQIAKVAGVDVRVVYQDKHQGHLKGYSARQIADWLDGRSRGLFRRSKSNKGRKRLVTVPEEVLENRSATEIANDA